MLPNCITTLSSASWLFALLYSEMLQDCMGASSLVIAAAQKKTQFHQKKECCAGALEGSFLKSLVRLTGAKTVLEVGMFTGTSSLSMAEALPSDGKVSAWKTCPACSLYTTCKAACSKRESTHVSCSFLCAPAC